MGDSEFVPTRKGTDGNVVNRARVLQDILRTGDFTRFTEVFDPGARANISELAYFW